MDRSTLQRLLEKHRVQMWRTALALTGNRADADDVLSEATLKVLEAANGFVPQDENHPRAWLLAIVRNTARTFLCVKRRRGPHLELMNMSETDPIQGTVSTGESSQNSFECREGLRNVVARLKELTPLRKQILVLVAQGYSYPEISEKMQIPMGTVSTNIRRARAQLIREMNAQPADSCTTNQVASKLGSREPSHVPKVNLSMQSDAIIAGVAAYYGITVEEILGTCRKQCFAFPRQMAMYLLRKEIKSSFPKIASHLGGRDHTTVMYACRKIRRLTRKTRRSKMT